MLGIDDRRIVNFDETNCYFSPDLLYTIAGRGSRTVTIAKPESSQRCTVMLGGSLAGELFPPFVIFKGKNNGCIQEYCCKPEKHGWASGLYYRALAKAWMDEASLMDWVLQVWAPWTKTVGKPTLLILDKARAHMTANIQQQLSTMGTEVEYIPVKLTSKLQPMDVGMNKPFKDHMRHYVENFTIEFGVDKKPTQKDVSGWIKQARYNVGSATLRST